MSGLAAVIIADDLTGALDSSSPFAALGLTSVTAVSPEGLALALATGAQVLAVNLGTRELGPDEAEARATAAAQVLRPFTGPDTLWLKKIDSRLKGSVGAEVAGVASVMHPDRVLLCPAIPELGRTVRQGLLSGHGIAAPIPVRVTLPPDLPLEVPDARSDADLDHLAIGADPRCLFVGARGLAAALARWLGREGHPLSAPSLRGPVGFAIGSRDPITLAQVAMLRASGGPGWIAAPDGQVPPPRSPGPVLVQATPGTGANPEVVSRRLAEGMLPHLPGLGTLVVTGGETAAALLRAAGISHLQVMGEVLPGLPLCHARGTTDFPALVTKSGGFGPPDTLLRLWQAARSPEGCPCP